MGKKSLKFILKLIHTDTEVYNYNFMCVCVADRYEPIILIVMLCLYNKHSRTSCMFVCVYHCITDIFLVANIFISS